MANKVNLLLDFANGQGAGFTDYFDYATDLDSNFSSLQASLNAVIDEVAAARLADALLPRDIIERRDLDTASGGARFSHDEMRVTRSGNIVTISAGRAFIKSTRIALASAAATDFTGLSNATYRIPIDSSGQVLAPTTTADSAFFDVATVVWDGSLVDADITDNLFNNGQILMGSDIGFFQEPADPGAITSNVFNVSYPGRLHPSIRYVSKSGGKGDAGFFAGAQNAYGWVSERDGGNGVGDTVLAGIYSANGQYLGLEQARAFVVKTGVAQAIATATLTAVQFDLLPATNVAAAAERFEPESYTASTDWQSGGSNENLVIPSSSSFDGTYLFTATVNMNLDDSVATYLDVRIVQTVGGTQIVARERVRPSGTGPTLVTLSGLFDFVNGDTFQLQVEHNHGANRDLDFARLTCTLVGGGV